MTNKPLNHINHIKMFTTKDKEQIQKKGIELLTIERQLNYYRTGFPFAQIQKPATIENGGIKKFHEKKVEELINNYNEFSQKNKIVKFVPASGAATRMFKELLAFLNSEEKIPTQKNNIDFFANIKNFAFYEDLNNTVQKLYSVDIEQAIEQKDYKKILKAFLLPEGLDYSNLPKGLLKFHKYPETSRTSLEEHIVETVNYSSSEGLANVHFTILPEHIDGFKEVIEQVKTKYEQEFNVKLEYSFSSQNTSSDTIVVDLQDEPFRNEDGTLLFRPAGHGALIENLNKIDADIIYIKNIDNVVPDKLRQETYTYKKVILGFLYEYQQQIFKFLEKLQSQRVTKKNIVDIIDFIEDELNVTSNRKIRERTKAEQIESISRVLNRPIRVCGMVKNEGEPGGGPFFMKNTNKSTSLQIVEKSQIDPNDPEASEYLKNATHFNPVDLVCGIKNYQGEKFDLMRFVDKKTGFITEKSINGREYKAQELPGLWNGAMSDWNTFFVEVPLITFNPVKTINDLLREEHK